VEHYVKIIICLVKDINFEL